MREHRPVEPGQVVRADDVAERPAGRERDRGLAGRVLGAAEPEERDGERIRDRRQHGPGHGLARGRVRPLVGTGPDLDEAGRRLEVGRAVVGPLVVDAVACRRERLEAAEHGLHERGRAGRDPVGLAAERGLADVAGRVDRQLRHRLDRGVAREKDHEVRVEAPVDPFGVDQPSLDLVKLPVVGRPELVDQGLAPAPDPDAGRILDRVDARYPHGNERGALRQKTAPVAYGEKTYLRRPPV